jgi:hypothetical protein
MPAFTGVESGNITEVEEQENAFIIYFEVDSDFELGITVFKDDIYDQDDSNAKKRFWRPEVGETIEVNMGRNGLLSLKFGGDEIFTRSEEQAAIWKEIRRLQVEAARLQEKLGSV